MQPSLSGQTILTTEIILEPAYKTPFINWQKKFHSALSSFSGFKSIEISSPASNDELHWVITEQFQDADSTIQWQESQMRKDLFTELQSFSAHDKENSFHELLGETNTTQHGITEVFVTRVAPEKEELYHAWIAKIHAVEANFPGFRGVYVQSPRKGQERNWITFLRFDSQQNLDQWLSSPERKQFLKEADSMIESLETHRVISPYGGWFGSINKGRTVPPVWKQTMVILLVLFPIVVLEIKYLAPLTQSLNHSLATFIANGISVSLLAWPLLPIVIRRLTWWLTPEKNGGFLNGLLGTCIVLFIYLIEIILFWNFI